MKYQAYKPQGSDYWLIRWEDRILGIRIRGHVGTRRARSFSSKQAAEDYIRKSNEPAEYGEWIEYENNCSCHSDG